MEPRTNEESATELPLGLVARLTGMTLAWLALLGAQALAIPRCKKLFLDFGMKLPAMTEAVIHVSDYVSAWLPLSLVPLGLFLATLWLVIPSLYNRKATRRLAHSLLLVTTIAPFVIAAVTVLSLGLVVVKIQEGLSR